MPTRWDVLDEVTGSDHRYIRFKIGSYVVRQKSKRFKTKSHNISKFDQLLRNNRYRLDSLFRNVQDDAQFYIQIYRFYNERLVLASRSFRRKGVKNNPQSTWWTPVLRMQRYKVKALHHRLQNAQRDAGIRVRYNRELALYKKSALRRNRVFY